MTQTRWKYPRIAPRRWVAICALTALPAMPACDHDSLAALSPPQAYRDRILVRQSADGERLAEVKEEPVATGRDGQAPRKSLLVGATPTTQPSLADVLEKIPDPHDAERVFNVRLDQLRKDAPNDSRVVKSYEKTAKYALELLQMVRRDRQLELSLSDCIRRALENSYDIRIAAFNPAISQTQIVEAEAAFDAVFFLDASWNNRDAPTASQLASGQSDQRSIRGGFRKLLPAGGQITTSLAQNRVFTDLSFQTLNPAYSTNFVTTFTQPLLRGFGLDVARSQILVNRINYRTTREQFMRQVRDTLFNVEQAYWALVQARRSAAIQAESVAQNRTTYDLILERGGFDATQVEINNALSRWKNRLVSFQETAKSVSDAEDALKNLLNDPDLRLSDDLELIPTEMPTLTPFMVDQFAEVRTAVDNRTEIREAKLAIEQARVNTTVAKNQALPQLDFTFTYDVGGIGKGGDSSLDNLTTNRFRSFNVGLSLAYALGNRAPRAAHHRARLQEEQAIVTLYRVTDGVVKEVNDAVRAIFTRFEQIPTSYDASVASENNLRAMQARALTITPSFLETELNSVERLTTDRTRLLQVIVDFNVQIVTLERAKGTLLNYNNVVVDHDDGRR